ncbi:MAG: F0F1 ATP synthase subunit delta [Verrucomicrobiota bacterium]|nr:F0F1 ATP synthase subunit delta [Verrucomicrobiota bacterium]
MHSKKAIKQYVGQLLSLSMENGRVNAERVDAVLNSVRNHATKSEIKPILKQYLHVIRREIAKTEAVVEHVGPLSGTSLQTVLARLSLTAGTTVSAVTRENPALIAGMRVRLGDDVYDSSVAGRLALIASEVN